MEQCGAYYLSLVSIISFWFTVHACCAFHFTQRISVPWINNFQLIHKEVGARLLSSRQIVKNKNARDRGKKIQDCNFLVLAQRVPKRTSATHRLTSPCPGCFPKLLLTFGEWNVNKRWIAIPYPTMEKIIRSPDVCRLHYETILILSKNIQVYWV